MRLAVLMTSCAMPVMAQDISLSLPIDCTLGDTCYIQNYVDHDPSDAASDFQCGGLTYDTHKGTDFGLISLAAMERGVDVFASAPGTVRGVRNDMRDVLFTSDLSSEITAAIAGTGLLWPMTTAGKPNIATCAKGPFQSLWVILWNPVMC
jgi:hypothetical protein